MTAPSSAIVFQVPTPSGGVAPFTYQWSVKRGRMDIPFAPDFYVMNGVGVPQQVIPPKFSLGQPQNSPLTSIIIPAEDQIVSGTIQCKVTDSKGTVAIGSICIFTDYSLLPPP